MEIFKGPLGSHLNYISMIALANCCDYFDLVKEHKEKSLNKTPDQVKRLRYFLNAITSLNNIPEYIYHEYKEEKALGKENDFLNKFREAYPIMNDIAVVANAYKHCQRRKENDVHAKDLQNPSLIIQMAEGSSKSTFNIDSIEDEELLGEAFRFWAKYKDNQNIDLLVRGELETC